MSGALFAAATTDGVNEWAFHLHPEVWVIVATAAIGYWWLVTRVGPQYAERGTQVVSRRQATWFYLGLGLLWLGADYPIHDIGENYLFSVHMVQHMLFTLAAAPLLIMGVPPWMLRWLLRPPALSGFVKWVARPVPATALFNGATVLSHWPALVNLALRNELVHFGVHFVIFGTALLMWFPVLNRVPEYPMLTRAGRIPYLFLQSIIPAIPAAFITFAEGTIYTFYDDVPRPWDFDVIADQQLAGAIMKLAGTVVLWGCMTINFFKWWDEKGRNERRDRARAAMAGARHPEMQGTDPGAEVLTWDEVQRELDRTKPATPA